MMLSILAILSLLFALLPAWVFFKNFSLFRRLPSVSGKLPLPAVSVLIPARNEEASIGPCIQAVLANQAVTLEVVVLDDQSEDQTADVVKKLSRDDPRVRLESATALPAGWCGKQYACSQLAELAQYDRFAFLDADVRLSPDALQRMVFQFERDGVDLLSGFPRQVTHTLAEQMLIPLMHFVLLGFLSLKRMRASRHPAFGAGCGQLFMTSRKAYRQSGGHTAIRNSLHDGLKLPRSYRSHDLNTDLFDASDVASCRMYCNATEVWHGLKKNATEGVASVGLIVPVTVMLLLGQVLPFAVLVFGGIRVAQMGLYGQAAPLVISVIAVVLALLPRIVAACCYQQSLVGALLHPLSIVWFLAVQWSALIGSFSRSKVAWKGRPYPA